MDMTCIICRNATIICSSKYYRSRSLFYYTIIFYNRDKKKYVYLLCLNLFPEIIREGYTFVHVLKKRKITDRA